MRTTSILLFSLLTIQFALAQDPMWDGMNYQAIVRDANGDPLPNQAIGMQFVIAAGLSQLYIEDQQLTTNDQGLISVVVGTGTVTGGTAATWADIDWSLQSTYGFSSYMDIAGGTNYQFLGYEILRAVPYAQRARTAETLVTGTGWSLNGNDLVNTNSGNVGIGGGPPTNKLTLYATGGNEKALRLDRATTSSENTILYTTAGSSKWAVGMNNSAGELFEFYSYQLGDFAMSLTPSGYVGIRNTSPNHELDVQGVIKAGSGSQQVLLNQSLSRGIAAHNTGLGSGGGYSISFGKNYATNNTVNLGYAHSGNGSLNNRLDVSFHNGTSLLSVLAGGNVGIGTTTPQSKLAVDGKITCKEVEVTLSGFPDYVFEEDYDMMSLAEVEAYIKEHGHLPNVPSAKEVEENGLGLGEMNKLLLEKVEELTLHAIDSEKRIRELEELLKRVSALESVLDQE